MKTKKLEKKLTLGKVTVAALNGQTMNGVRGGSDGYDCFGSQEPSPCCSGGSTETCNACPQTNPGTVISRNICSMTCTNQCCGTDDMIMCIDPLV